MEEEHIQGEESGIDVQRGLLLDVTARNQMELIAIADNKANAITTICILLIVLIIIAFSAGLEVGDVPLTSQIEFVLPLGVMLIFCSIAAICAIMALKPKIIRSTKKQNRGMLFFHNYYRKTLKDYREEMRGVMRTKESIYDQMMTNIYYNGQVLERKYALLGIAYTVFLLAIVCSVTAYVIASVI